MYQLPVYFFQFEHILRMIAGDGLLKTNMRVLDVGTGPGVVPLAFIDFLSRLKGGSATIDVIEQSTEQIEAFKHLVPGYAKESGKVVIGRTGPGRHQKIFSREYTRALRPHCLSECAE